VALLRALPVWSQRLGLSGKCDVVEARLSAECGMRNAESKLEPPDVGCYERLAPVEYKKGV
jgi:hypothetical protein